MTTGFYAVIMAGGGGTRLWPLSRQDTPKQMLPLVGDRSLFQIAVDRLKGVFTPERIFVVTVADQAEKLGAQCPHIPRENFLIEPMPRGTAAVVGLAAVALKQRDPRAVMAVLTADHIFENESYFRDLLLSAYEAAWQNHLVTLGIRPTFPSTGFGYIQQGDQLDSFRGVNAFQVLRFKEKPDQAQAQIMFEAGDHVWNSGMFVWQVKQIMAEFERQMPELASKLETISTAWNQPATQAVIRQVWPQIQPQTIDYGIMENAREVVVIPAEGLGWDDVGSWEALFDVFPADEAGNITVGENVISLDTRDTLVHKEGVERLIVTIGVEDLIVVDSGDVLLVCKKDQAQKVRQIVKQLKKSRSKYV